MKSRGNEEIISKYTDKVIGGTIITGFEWVDNAEIHVSVEGGPMTVGRFPNGTDKEVLDFVNLIKSSVITSYSIHYTKLYETQKSTFL